MLETGLFATLCQEVDQANSAAALGSGELPVFATPAMILLIEKTCCKALEKALEQGDTTVGTHLDIRHLKPTVVGGIVTCRCELIEIDGAQLVFSARCEDEAGLVGEGIHRRCIVNFERFMERAHGRAGK